MKLSERNKYIFSSFVHFIIGLVVALIFSWFAYNFLGFLASNLTLTLLAYCVGLAYVFLLPSFSNDYRLVSNFNFCITILSVILYYCCFMFIMPMIFGSNCVLNGSLGGNFFGFELDISHIYIFLTILFFCIEFYKSIIRLIKGLLFILLE